MEWLATFDLPLAFKDVFRFVTLVLLSGAVVASVALRKYGNLVPILGFLAFTVTVLYPDVFGPGLRFLVYYGAIISFAIIPIHRALK